MRRRALRVLVSAALLTLWAVPAGAASSPGEALSPAQVVEFDRAFDGAVITVEGEAVGESLRATGGGRWVNVYGDEVGLGIWMTDSMAEEIEHFGDYHHDGDTIRIVGTLSFACEQHGGEFDVHAQSMEVLSTGQPRSHEVRFERAILGLGGAMMAAVLWRVYRTRRG